MVASTVLLECSVHLLTERLDSGNVAEPLGVRIEEHHGTQAAEFSLVHLNSAACVPWCSSIRTPRGSATLPESRRSVRRCTLHSRSTVDATIQTSGPLCIGLKCLEHLFFFKLIGDTPIDSFLLNMLEAPADP
ncbi:hypothetical protein HPB50_006288 [Hyalomma asiaticum]|uniref:Uncharacterized protein n=1 Tax=Hyalomma asiaticum TaxID=266040 RepID=A0ACB7SKV7_HYAAI|nr:hypothetical protein HPB50_006288 [Hyalomma asiaticum]